LISAAPGACPVCEHARLRPVTSPPGVTVFRCSECGHRVARHDTSATPQNDYHAQYDGGAFLDALRATRVRQAVHLIELLGRRIPEVSRVVDYGAGRGWFLEACRSAGVALVAGVDPSQIAVDGLTASGIEARQMAEDESASDTLACLSFRPRVVTLLDVVEHFPPDELRARLRSIVDACREDLEIVAMKVPVAGLLYGGASLLARSGAPRLLSQLYQVGTWPPHLNYFSTTSAERLLTTAGLRVVDRIGDPDFEPGSLGQRIGANGPVLRTLARVGGEAIRTAIRVTRRFDSAIFLAKPARV
jgi:hypothetical protein